MKDIRIAGIIKESIVDGPGIRFVIFTQGCIHNCKNCHNPETHDLNGGYNIEIDEIFNMIDKNPLLDGITLSGGEPFLQYEESLEICKRAVERNLSIIVYTGYTFEEIIEKSSKNIKLKEFLKSIDILIDGRYIDDKRDLLLKFRGSTNQRIIDIKESLEKSNIILLDL